MKGDPQYDAVALLAQIKAEKERLVKEVKIRKEKPLPPLADDDKPFDLPYGWVWVRLGEIIRITSSRRIFESEYVESGTPFYRSKEIGELSRTGETASNYFISNDRYQELKYSDDFPSKGDLLLTSVGSIGNTWIVDDREFYFKDGNITQLIHSQYLNVYYLQKFIGSSLFFDSVRDTVSGTVYNALTIIKIKQLAFPLPPLAEQQAIVARVDGLMAVIDDLEKQVAERKKQAQLLMQTVLREAFE
jgi:type I restriction enzyme S subunit